MEFEGNITKTAKSLKINRTTLYRKIRDYDMVIE
ncbi:MAG: helix-turn-helix domain-containing protein [Desulfitobacteriaceae bacterium]